MACSAGSAGALNFSRTAEADRNFTGFDDDGDLVPAVGKLEHALQALLVFENIYVLMRNLTAAECLPGAGGVRSEIFPEYQNFFIHVARYLTMAFTSRLLDRK
jgi:hypothetical protein